MDATTILFILNKTILPYYIFFILAFMIGIICYLKKHAKSRLKYYGIIMAVCAALGIIFINCTNALKVPYFSEETMFLEFFSITLLCFFYLIETLFGGGMMVVISIIYGLYGAFLGALGCYIYEIINKRRVNKQAVTTPTPPSE